MNGAVERSQVRMDRSAIQHSHRTFQMERGGPRTGGGHGGHCEGSGGRNWGGQSDVRVETSSGDSRLMPHKSGNHCVHANVFTPCPAWSACRFTT